MGTAIVPTLLWLIVEARDEELTLLTRDEALFRLGLASVIEG